jgi:hypothetical protein
MTDDGMEFRRVAPLPHGIPDPEEWGRDVYFLREPTGCSLVVNAVRAHWDALRGQRLCPRRNEIDPVEIWATLRYLTLVDFLEDPFRVRMSLIGSEIARRSPGQKEGGFLHEMDWPVEDLVDTTEAYTRVHNERRPLYGLSRVTFEDRGGYVFEWALFPLSEDGGSITGALGVDDYTAVADRHPTAL